MEAAIQVIDQLGYQGTTTNHIAERAGVSVGTLYQYFSNKDEIVAALIQAHREHLAEDLLRELEQSSSQDFEEAVRQIVRALIRSHLVRIQARSFVTQTRLDDQRQKPGEGLFAQLLRSKLEEAAVKAHPNAPKVPDDVGMFVLITSVIGVVRNTVIHAPELLENPGLENHLVRLVCGYLEIAQT